ncbi:sphingosine-1-phosphate phosphatase 2-like [Glandiceps talaboti]
MEGWIDYLRSSHTIAKFQTQFGVEIIKADHRGVTDNSKDNDGHQRPFDSYADGNRCPNVSTAPSATTQGKDGNTNGNVTSTGNGTHLSTHEYGEGVKRLRQRGNIGSENGTDNISSDTLVDSETGETSSSSDKPKVEYKIHNRFWYYLFLFGASLGNEVFFIAFIPFCGWNLSLFVIRRLVIVWAIVLYLGQGAKDIIKWPRPTSPPVVKLEHLYEKEYGMPSTHAMMGLSLPFTILYLTMDRYQYPFILGLLVAVSWCTVVCLSRFYLGMHSVLDVIVGLIFATVIIVIVNPYLGDIDVFLTEHKYGAVTGFLIGLTMAVCYPTLDRWSAARGDATLILGVGTGAVVGMWFKINYNILPLDPVEPLPYEIPTLNLQWLMFMVLKTLVGVIIMLITKVVMKEVIYHIVCFFLNIQHSDAKATELVVIELPRKFFTYMVVSLNAIVLIPVIHKYLGLI